MSREQWLEDRKLSIGASEAAAVLGANPYEGPLSIWAKKLGLLKEDFDEVAKERMRWGHNLEPAILKEYQERTGTTVARHPQDEVVRHRGFPDVPLSCTPDGIEVDTGKPIQIKCTASHNRKIWEDGPPIWVTIQCQQEMLVCDKPEETVLVLFGGNKMESFDLVRDNAFCEALQRTLTEWWQSYVVARKEPPASTTASCVRILEKLHPNDNGDVVELASEFLDLDSRLVEVKAKLARLGREKVALESQIKAAIGEATFGEIPGVAKYSWKTTTRPGYNVDESTFRQLRRGKV